MCAAAAMRICDTTVSRTYASATTKENAPSRSREKKGEEETIHSETVFFWHSAGTSTLSFSAPFAL